MSLTILFIIALLYLASFWISASWTDRKFEKLSAYECGLEPIGDARMKFEIIYYVIGLLFLIFDLELIFLFPLATLLFNFSSLLGFWFLLIFFIIVTIGFIYEWYMGALNVNFE